MTVLLATVAAIAAPLGGHPADHHRRGCRKLFTVRMGERAARTIYRDGHTASRRNLRLLGYLERCQRNPRAQAFVRGFDRRHARDHARRAYAAAHPLQGPAVASWFDDTGGTACGTHYTYGFATLNGTPCGGRIVFYHDGHQVVGVREDSGPYVSGREFDLNPALKDALGCSDLCDVTWRAA